MNFQNILSGRLDRIRFLAYSNIMFIAMVIVSAIIQIMMRELLTQNMFIIYIIIGILYLVPVFIAARRYNDVGASSWWALWYLTPGQPIIFLLLALIPGMSSENKYGLPNKESGLILKALAIVPIVIVLLLIFWWQFIL